MNHNEFTPEQHESINQLYKIVRHISYLMYLLGALLLVVGHNVTATPAWVTSIAAAFFIILGIVFQQPLPNLKRATITAPDDVSQTIVAMDDLRAAFSAGQAALVFLIALALTGLSILLF